MKESDKARYACKIIFGPLFHYSPEIINYLQPCGLKSAFRNIIKNYHPDRAVTSDLSEQELNLKFKEIKNAYDYLLNLIKTQKQSFNYENINKKENNNYRKSNNNHKQNFHTTANKKDFFFKGQIPNRNLRFGEFLFYNKIISWQILINALVWQFRERPKFGEIAKKHQILTDKDIINILRKIKYNEKFGDCALRNGYITDNEHKIILKKQSLLNMPLGKYFIDNKLFTISEIINFLCNQNKHNFQVKKINIS